MADADRLTLSLSTGGDVVIKLRPDLAPGHVERITDLANSGFHEEHQGPYVGAETFQSAWFNSAEDWAVNDTASLIVAGASIADAKWRLAMMIFLDSRRAPGTSVGAYAYAWHTG